MSMQRILTVQDISCVGKCSGTVVLPVLSLFGVEAAILPTAILSTHTGFPGAVVKDLTEDIPTFAAHWKAQGVTFDGFYSGYLGSIRQIRMIRELFGEFRTGEQPILVDPVMGDHGRLYTGFTPEFASEMRTLCGTADLILPNLTEACALLQIPYRSDLSKAETRELVKRLSGIGCRRVMLTGAEETPGRIGALLYDAADDSFTVAETEKHPFGFHGTGDLFAATVAGGMLSGKSCAEAMAVAVEFAAEAIRVTAEDATRDARYGVAFEKVLGWLAGRTE